MNFFDNNNWRLTKFLWLTFGVWPYQDVRTRKFRRNIVALIIASIFIPEICKVFTSWGDVNTLIECSPILALHSLTITKMANCVFNMNKFKKILNRIEKDWHFELSLSEQQIMNECSQQTRKITHAYIFFIYGVTLMYLSTPMVPKVLDHFVPLNESRGFVFLYPTEYFVDPVEYQIPIFLHAYIISPFPSTVIVAFDSAYYICVQHASSMFIIVGHRLQMLFDNINYMIDNDEIGGEKIYQSIADCIKMHQKNVSYSQLLESTYTTCLLVIVTINMLALSITGYYTIIKLNETAEASRFGIFTIGQVIHLYFLSYPAQSLMDRSLSIRESIYSSKWYRLPPKTRHLLILIMMRSGKPCKLTAGNIYKMSYESFATVIKTSASYFTVLTSME